MAAGWRWWWRWCVMGAADGDLPQPAGLHIFPSLPLCLPGHRQVQTTGDRTALHAQAAVHPARNLRRQGGRVRIHLAAGLAGEQETLLRLNGRLARATSPYVCEVWVA